MRRRPLLSDLPSAYLYACLSRRKLLLSYNIIHWKLCSFHFHSQFDNSSNSVVAAANILLFCSNCCQQRRVNFLLADSQFEHLCARHSALHFASLFHLVLMAVSWNGYYYFHNIMDIVIFIKKISLQTWLKQVPITISTLISLIPNSAFQWAVASLVCAHNAVINIVFYNVLLALYPFIF